MFASWYLREFFTLRFAFRSLRSCFTLHHSFLHSVISDSNTARPSVLFSQSPVLLSFNHSCPIQHQLLRLLFFSQRPVSSSLQFPSSEDLFPIEAPTSTSNSKLEHSIALIDDLLDCRYINHARPRRRRAPKPDTQSKLSGQNC